MTSEVVGGGHWLISQSGWLCVEHYHDTQFETDTKTDGQQICSYFGGKKLLEVIPTGSTYP